MATENRTPTVNSYLGHPCSIAPLLQQHETLREFAEMRASDLRALVQGLGGELAQLNARAMYSQECLQVLQRMAQDEDQREAVDSFLAMASDYALGTCDLVSSLTIRTLAVLQQAELVERSQAASGAATA